MMFLRLHFAIAMLRAANVIGAAAERIIDREEERFRRKGGRVGQ